MPFVLSLLLAGLSLIALIVGGVLTLILSGQTTHRHGADVGAEIMGGQDDDDVDGAVVVQRSFFVGRAAAVNRHATIDLAEVKQQLAAGNCLSMIPALLAIGGFAGVLFFGALAALLGIPGIVSGVAMLMALYTLVRMGIAFIRA